MAHQSFRKNVLSMALKLSNETGEVTTDSLSVLLMIMSKAEHKRMLNTLSELAGEGKLRRIRQGVYGPVVTAGNPDKREVMWRVMRMRRAVTVADLQEMAGVSSSYASEWLELLVRREVAVRIVPANPKHPHSWRLVKSDLEMPVDDEKAARLRDIRRKKKAAITGKLDAIDTALGEVRKILKNLEEE